MDCTPALISRTPHELHTCTGCSNSLVALIRLSSYFLAGVGRSCDFSINVLFTFTGGHCTLTFFVHTRSCCQWVRVPVITTSFIAASKHTCLQTCLISFFQFSLSLDYYENSYDSYYNGKCQHNTACCSQCYNKRNHNCKFLMNVSNQSMV